MIILRRHMTQTQRRTGKKGRKEKNRRQNGQRRKGRRMASLRASRELHTFRPEVEQMLPGERIGKVMPSLLSRTHSNAAQVPTLLILDRAELQGSAEWILLGGVHLEKGIRIVHKRPLQTPMVPLGQTLHIIANE